MKSKVQLTKHWACLAGNAVAMAAYLVRSLPVWVFLCFFNDNWAHLLSILQSSTRIDHTQWEHHEDGKSASILGSTPGIHGSVLGHFGAKPLFDAVLKVLQNLQPKEQKIYNIVDGRSCPLEQLWKIACICLTFDEIKILYIYIYILYIYTIVLS